VLSARARWGYKLLIGENTEQLRDAMLVDGLTDPLTHELMGEETERLCQRAQRHARRVRRGGAWLSKCARRGAAATGKFAAEIAPLEITAPSRRCRSLRRTKEFARRHPRAIAGGAAPGLWQGGRADGGQLQPAFRRRGGARAGQRRAVKQYGLKPMAKILGGAWAGVESWRFVEGPVPAVRKLMKKLGAEVGSFDLVENNEAFALNNVLLRKLLGVPYERINVHGGAIALGHPIGASGARILVTLVHALHTHGKARGLATLCHGVGGGTAVAVETVG
jgi:acetyl-CoA C-acetyltransferase